MPGQVNSCWFAWVRLMHWSLLAFVSPGLFFSARHVELHLSPPKKYLKGAAWGSCQWLGQISSCYLSPARLFLYLNDIVFKYPFTAKWNNTPEQWLSMSKMPLHWIRSDHRRIIKAAIVQTHPCFMEIPQLHHVEKLRWELETDLQSRLHQTSSCRHWSEPKNKYMRMHR